MKTTTKNKKQKWEPITARGRYVELPKGSLVWPGYVVTESGNRISADFVLLPPNGKIHSIEEQGTGAILHYESLKPFNRGRAMFTKESRMRIYDLYGMKEIQSKTKLRKPGEGPAT